MAIAYDNSSSSRIYTGITPSFTVAANTMMFAVTGSNCTAASYNGASLTNIIDYQPGIDSNSVEVKIWTLANPDSGTHNFAFTTNGGNSTCFGVITYSGFGTSQPETHNDEKSFTSGPPAASQQVATFTSTVATQTNNAWATTFIVGTNNAGRTFTAGSNTTARTSYGDLLCESVGILDSNGPVSPAGSRSLVSNWSSSGGFVSTVTLSIAPPKTGGGFMILLK